MKRRVLSLTMAFLLAFTMLPTQAAAEELPEYEEVVEENVPEEEVLETESLDTESPEAEEPAAEAENTEETVLTEETEETVTEAEPVEEVTEAPAAEETEESEVKEEVLAEQEETSEAPAKEETTTADEEKTTETAPVQETASPAEEIQPAEQNTSVQAMEENGVVVQAEDGDEGTTVTPCKTHTFENGVCTVCQYKCTHEKATGTECPDCKMTLTVIGDKDGTETRYASFAEAFANAPSGSTLTLLDHVNDEGNNYWINKDFTINTGAYNMMLGSKAPL